jgi:hypothetical protein
MTGRKRPRSAFPNLAPLAAPHGEAAQIAAIVIAPSGEEPAAVLESRIPLFLRGIPVWRERA